MKTRLRQVPGTFASQLKSPCWRSDAPFPSEVIHEIAAKAEARARARGKGGRGPAWVAEMAARASTPARFDVGARRARRGLLSMSHMARAAKGETGKKAADKADTADKGADKGAEKDTDKAFGAGGKAGGKGGGKGAGKGRGGGGGQPKKKPGGRPGSADGDAGERVYTLPMHLRDRGVPKTLGWLCLPYFLLLGVPKSGTTALYEMIAAHPQVRPHVRKQSPSNGKLSTQGLSWFRSLASLRTTV